MITLHSLLTFGGCVLNCAPTTCSDVCDNFNATDKVAHLLCMHHLDTKLPKQLQSKLEKGPLVHQVTDECQRRQLAVKFFLPSSVTWGCFGDAFVPSDANLNHVRVCIPDCLTKTLGHRLCM